MTFVSQTEDTWDILVDLAVEVMQEIWDAIGTYEYEITTSIPVYQKYVISFGSKTKLRYIFFRRFNTARTRGEMFSGPVASRPF